MNKTIQDILNRRSTRIFTEEQLSDEELDQILQAGIYAPSAHNDQSWHFTILQNKDLMEEINIASKEAAKTIADPILRRMARNEKFNVFYNAPTVIVISGKEDAMMPKVDCAVAAENMLIAAESLDIGSCWIGFAMFVFEGPDSELYAKKLHIPEGYKPLYAIAFGYKKNPSGKAPERKGYPVNFVK